MKNKITFVVGTRPEIIKIAPIANKVPSIILFTGQHFDANMSDNFFELLKISKIINLKTKKNYSVQQMAKNISSELFKLKTDKVVVQGDTNSTLAGAIATKFVKKKLYFIESGMRSKDLMQVEEYNRILVSHLADINFCNHRNNKVNLVNEHISSKKIKITGSTVYSSLKLIDNQISKNTQDNFILLTLHRPENVDQDKKLNKLLNTINKLNAEIVFPIHPRTESKIDKKKFKNIKFIKPQNYLSFVSLMKNSKFIISDSGGVQEEAAILRKPLLIPREYTERPEMLKMFNLLVSNVKELNKESKDLLNNVSKLSKTVNESKLLYGDEKVVNKIIKELND